MPEFKPVILSDRKWMYPVIYSTGTRNADFSFMNIYGWGASYAAAWSIIEGCLVICTEIESECYFSYPIEVKDDEKLKSVVEPLVAGARERGKKLVMHSIPKEALALLEKTFGGQYELSPATDYFDYVYSIDRLASLEGKKLHAKRNYINRFVAENEWRFDPMTSVTAPLCAELDREWMIERHESDEETAIAEALAIKKALTEFDELGLDGAFLYAGGRPCAFTIGERLSEDTYVAHFEKADSSITGAYQMINREFARYIKEKYPEVKYINREEDMGLENLRKAKLSYFPDFMEEKYTAVWKI